jgi:EAL domain-containing protein (putative c-di-GMP-specific phosphodiesterase class I)
VSAVEFNSRGFLDRVSTILDETGLEPHYLEIEITETAAMRDVAATSLVLEALRKRGVHFAMDDFGTGYSSLSNLMLFPIDTLKIDKSFVMDVKTNDDAATIVSAVISLGQSLRLRIVAEGIETVEQLSFLQSRACSEGQGYYFSKPIAAGEFRNLINSEPNKS